MRRELGGRICQCLPLPDGYNLERPSKKRKPLSIMNTGLWRASLPDTDADEMGEDVMRIAVTLKTCRHSLESYQSCLVPVSPSNFTPNQSLLVTSSPLHL
ncbi:unnamed protein product [Nezara viridula]|uniref:Uncharacterized protein n=1 Tax=Nezara viridula TaxID=85310 RepID=A0A9P0HLL4_NEZVI|nr:unnamed protein product [Nezara viridula]